MLREVASCLSAGFRDSLRFPLSGGAALVGSAPFRRLALHNGLLFLGSYVAFSWLLDRIRVEAFAELGPGAASFVTSICGWPLVVGGWLIPLYLYSVYANSAWHGDVAAELVMVARPAATARAGSPASGGSGSVSAVTVDVAYKVLVYNAMLALSFLSGFLPFFVGPVMQATLYSWLYSVYCFAFRWRASGWTLLQSIDFFEIRWLYFVGFGAPLTVVSYATPSFFASYAAVSVLIPVFCLSALQSDSPPRQDFVPRLRLRYVAEAALLQPLVSRLSVKRAKRREKIAEDDSKKQL